MGSGREGLGIRFRGLEVLKGCDSLPSKLSLCVLLGFGFGGESSLASLEVEKTE